MRKIIDLSVPLKAGIARGAPGADTPTATPAAAHRDNAVYAVPALPR